MVNSRSEMQKILNTTNQEVVVIGAGLAGLVAAIEATDKGAKVTVIDKLGPMLETALPPMSNGRVGNDTARSMGGGLARFSLEDLMDKLDDRLSHKDSHLINNTDSSVDPIDQLYTRHMQRSSGKIDGAIIETYLKRVSDDCKWFRDELGAQYENRMIKGGGYGLIAFLYRVAAERGINVVFNAKAIRLLTDDAGRVTGIHARGVDVLVNLEAKATVLATGSFSGNQEMLLKYTGPEIAYNTILTGCPTNTGDGHLMASAVGAQLINLSVCHIRTTDKFFGPGPSRILKNIYPMGLYINRDCQRFLDEGVADSDTIGNAIAFQPGGVAALIFDRKAVDKNKAEYERYPRKEEVIQVANSIEELATMIEVSPEKLQKLVADFNNSVKDGKAMQLAIPKTEQACSLNTPPFYSFYPVLPGLNHPLGGLRTNSNAQVVDREGSVIPGLYAAGSILNWSFGRPFTKAGVISYQGSYHAGATSGLAIALVFGRIAGREAAEEALR